MLRRFGLTVLLPGIVLLLFGLRAIEQDRRAVEREIGDRMQQAAELAARAVDQQLANWQQFRKDGVTLATGSRLNVVPADRLAYQPGEDIHLETPEPALEEAEQQEFRGDVDRATALYRRAAGIPGLRAKALMRLARTYAKAGQRGLAAGAYMELLKVPEPRAGPVSAELIARFELCRLGAGDRPAFYHDLVAGRWPLDKARYLFYSEATRGWVGNSDPARQTEQGKLAVSAAIEEYLQNRRRLLADHVAFWHEEDSLIVPVEVLRRKLEKSVALDRNSRIQLVSASARRPPLAAVHALSDRDLPWVVVAAPVDSEQLFAGSRQRRSVYVAMLLAVFLLLIAGSYTTARAVNREIEVARIKSEFVSTVSHEFRSPLTAIRQLAELLQRGRVASDEKRREYYGLIARESDRLSRLVENLLDFSRLEEGRKQYQFERLDTSAWLRELASAFYAGNVSTSIPSDLPAILGDREALTSAVANLLDNAVKYSPPGAPVEFEAKASGEKLTIWVRDHGYGIAEEDRKHIFEKFYRGAGEIARKVKGAGVGLSLVRQIVQAHGGTVDFDSRLGEGSVFRIRLRVA